MVGLLSLEEVALLHFFNSSENLPNCKELLMTAANVGIKSSRCSFNRLVGTGSKMQLLVADIFTIHPTSWSDNMLNSENL